MQRLLFFVGISGKMRALYVAPNICNNCYNRLFIGFCSDGHHMSMKCCFINMLHGVMKCARCHRRLHRHFRLFWAVLCQTSQTASLSVLQLVVAVCCPIIYDLYVRLIRVRGTPRFRTMWDCTCTGRTGAGGTAPVRFSLCVMQW